MTRVLVVARREVLQGFGQRSFLISTAFSIAVLAAIVLLPSALGFDGPARQDVAVTSGPSADLVRAAQAGQDELDVEIEVQVAASDAEAERRVRDGDADLAVVDEGRRVIADDGASDAALGLLQQRARTAQAARALERAGVPDATAREVLEPPGLEVTTSEAGSGEAIAFVALIVLYGQLIGYGFVVASGLVEEKSSRVVEILLSVLRPRELLLGKVLGIGLVGLAQLLLISGAGLALGAGSGDVDLDADAWAALGIVLAWFLLGYAFFSAAFAVAGALVPRQEDLQTVTTPLTFVLVGAFILSFPAISEPDGGLAQTLSFVPFSAPLVMPARLIAGDVPAWEVLAAVASVAAGTALLVLLAGRVYRAAALETSAKVGLFAALRRAA